MNTHQSVLRNRTPRTSTWVLAGILALTPAAVRAAPPVVPQIRISQSSHPNTQRPILADSWGEWKESIWSNLASRRAMMRFGAILMIVALAAIWWRKT